MKMIKIEAEGNTLNSDIIEHHILPGLPAKSLFRFKSVCKRWLSLISDDPVFIRQHCQSLKASSFGLVCQGNKGELKFISTDQTPIGAPDPTLSFMGFPFSFVMSCGGLLCGVMPSGSHNKIICLCNPVTQETADILITGKICATGFAFDPSTPTAPYHLVCPYTIRRICFKYSHSHVEYGFYVFSSDTQVWRQSKEKIIVPNHGFLLDGSVFVDGFLYFEVHDYDVVVWFNPEKDLAGVAPLPLNNREYSVQCIGEWDGRLSYTRVTLNEIEIWVMTGFQWSKRHCVKLESIVEGKVCVFASLFHSMNLRSRKASNILIKRLQITPLPFSGGDELLFRVRANIFSYNMKTGEAVHVGVCEDNHSYKCFPYRNSLVPIPKQELDWSVMGSASSK